MTVLIARVAFLASRESEKELNVTLSEHPKLQLPQMANPT